MTNGWKAALALGAGAIALKIWSDSQALASKLSNPLNTVPGGTVSVGGQTLPTPTPSLTGVYAPVGFNVLSPQSQSNQEANPSTDYGRDYWYNNLIIN